MPKLRIVVTVDPYIPVPPVQYGGIERIVAFVVNGLVARGHEVMLMAHPESRSAATLVGYGVPPHFTRYARVKELWQVSTSLLRQMGSIDAVLSWGRLAALIPVLPRRSLAKIQRYCRPLVPWRSVRIASRLAGASIVFAAASSQMYLKRPNPARYGKWVTIYDGVELQKFQPVLSVPADAPLVFLGALEPRKGAHHAIAIAKGSGRKLVIAGNRVEKGSSAGYFESFIAPHLDGVQIRYVGPVDDTQKNTLLGQCAAFLMPTEWEETFGIVMAEAMACGTPVIAFDRGSIPEVVCEGINGYRCRSAEDAILAVSRLDRIDRAAVRADCEARFNSDIIVDAYETLLGELVQQCRGSL
jgi:glycosyltransferase involved in cell wall biosynthesis